MTRAGTVQKFSWWYESIIDWMLANPDKFIVDAAKHFDASESHFRRIISSDAFQERYQERRQQHTEHLSESIVRRMQGVAEAGLTIIEKELKSQESKKTPLMQVVDLTDKTLHRLGYGVPKPGASAVTINQSFQQGPQLNPASSAAILEARNRIRSEQLDAVRREAIEVDDEVAQLALPLGERARPVDATDPFAGKEPRSGSLLDVFFPDEAAPAESGESGVVDARGREASPDAPTPIPGGDGNDS